MTDYTYSANFTDDDIGNVANWGKGTAPAIVYGVDFPTLADDVTFSMVDSIVETLTIDITAKTIVWDAGLADAPTNVGNHKFTIAGNGNFSGSDTNGGHWDLVSGSHRLYLEFSATATYTPPSASPTYSFAATAGTITPSTALTGTKKCQIINFTGASTLSMANGSITADGNCTLGTGGLTNSAGKTLTVGGNFLTNGNLPGGTFAVTGTAIAAAGKTITGCTFTGTRLNATAAGCIDGGGNSGVDFPPAVKSDKRAMALGLGLGL